MATTVLSRRAASLLLVAPALAACGSALGRTTPVPDDMTMGSARARVTVVEYASVACPVCGRWYRDVFPAFKRKYIDTNRVKFVSREMLVGDGGEIAAAAAGFLLARCAGRDRYFKVTDAIYRTQDALFANPRQALLTIAQTLGFKEAEFDRCVEDENGLKQLNSRVEANARRDNVSATPTFVINGVAMEAGYHPLSEIDEAIARAAKPL